MLESGRLLTGRHGPRRLLGSETAMTPTRNNGIFASDKVNTIVIYKQKVRALNTHKFGNCKITYCGAIVAIALLCVGLTVAACGGATHKSPTSIPKPRALHYAATPGSTGLSTAPSSNNAGFPKVPASEIYADGVQGTPHYFVSLSSKPDGHISGSMNFLYQDGQTVSVFTFAGSGQDGVASLSPVASGQFGPGNVIPASLPRTLSMTWGVGGISFGECTGYLPAVTSMSGCAFEPAYQGMSTSASAP